MGAFLCFSPFMWATLQPIITLARNAAINPLIAGIFGALVGLGLHQLADDMTFFPKIGVVAWALTGVGLAMVANARKSPRMLERALRVWSHRSATLNWSRSWLSGT